MATGLVLVATSVAVWLLAACGSPAPAAPSPAAAAPVPATQAAPPPAEPDTTGEAQPSAPAPPVRVRIGAIEVDAPVVQVGVDELGEMEIPEDVRTIGWYRFGPGPGASAGSSVLSGHVDDRIQGRGAFFDLREMSEGDTVQVDLADGTSLAYRVVRVERFDKDVLPVDQVFDRTGAPRLTLVTCGGDFDRATRNYQENIVVTAEPMS